MSTLRNRHCRRDFLHSCANKLLSSAEQTPQNSTRGRDGSAGEPLPWHDWQRATRHLMSNRSRSLRLVKQLYFCTPARPRDTSLSYRSARHTRRGPWFSGGLRNLVIRNATVLRRNPLAELTLPYLNDGSSPLCSYVHDEIAWNSTVVQWWPASSAQPYLLPHTVSSR
jgi:hypothetical protein